MLKQVTKCNGRADRWMDSSPHCFTTKMRTERFRIDILSEKHPKSLIEAYFAEKMETETNEL